MQKPILNIADANLRILSWGEGFSAQVARIGPLIGAKKMGCQLHVVPAGKKAFPFHAHHANEEMFYVVAGKGIYRVGTERHEIRAGDVISAPSGDGSSAHQIINTSNGDLHYLAFSTKLDPDVVEYPDSGEFAVSSMMSEQGGLKAARLFHVGRPGTSLDYWDGEE